ncbi:hypothetical protein HPP92_024755 [Vanilla planifolia]|uniref:Uncharacterized protein n=1 Tax=Vanilla planifolia TaxID=51239 RepID=A0A835PQF4_VANPL|nr:hypothetical protein HPP92_024755 [Vanilla planifolia]
MDWDSKMPPWDFPEMEQTAAAANVPLISSLRFERFRGGGKVEGGDEGFNGRELVEEAPGAEQQQPECLLPRRRLQVRSQRL